MELGNHWTLNDYINAKTAWLAAAGLNDNVVILWKFDGYETGGNSANPNEAFRKMKYQKRTEHVWLSAVKAFDAVRGGYFTTGDLDVCSDFPLQGYSAAYTLPDQSVIPEYGGDIIQWNGKLWEVADQLEPVNWGYQANTVYYHTVLRRTQASGISSTTGP